MSGDLKSLAASPGSFRAVLDEASARYPYLTTAAFGIVFVAAYWAAYRYGMAFSQASASPFWFPDSVLLCALLKTRVRHWWLLVLAILPIRLFSEVSAGVPWWFLGACIANDALKAVLIAMALRRFMHNPIRFESVRDFAVFFAFAVVLVPAASAFAGAAARAELGFDYWIAWEQWFFGNALTQLVVTPFIFYWVFGALWLPPRPSGARIVEGGAIAIGLIVVGAYSFTASSSSVYFAEARFFAPVPFLFWAAIRFGMAGATGAIATISFLALDAALLGKGPFAGHSPDDTAFALQNYLLLRAAPLLLIAASMERNNSVERALRESENRFGDLANATPALLWMVNREGGCAFVNNSYVAFTGRDLSQHLGTGWTQWVHPDDVEQASAHMRSAFDAREPFEIESRLRRHDGAWRWVLSVGVPRYDADREFLGYIGSTLDISDRRHVEEMRQTMGHAHRLAAMGELTAAIAHEVKQPLAAILANASAAMNLLDQENPRLDLLRETVADIRSDDLRANEVIDRIRAFARNQQPRMEPIDANGIVTDVVKLVAADTRRRGVRVETALEAGLPPMSGDRTQLQQVLLNLIANGMEAMAETPAALRTLTIRARTAGESVEISVSDCGSGIAPETLPQIFDSFYTTKADGMGLGLSVARSLIEAHRGRIQAENSLSGGATFRFSVPIAR